MRTPGGEGPYCLAYTNLGVITVLPTEYNTVVELPRGGGNHEDRRTGGQT